MKDDNWEAINGDAAHEIEVLNYSNQVNVIQALVHFLMHHYTGEDGTCAASPNENVVSEFHRTATLFLLHAPGAYRMEPVVVGGPQGVVHQPPPHEEVPEKMQGFFQVLETNWGQASAQEIAAYCLWMINWIHPFKNGNGRTARAFCYACICLKLGFVLPGERTVIDLIMDQRQEYYRALKIADLAFEAGKEPDLEPMIAFVDRLLFEQLSSIESSGD